MKCNNGEQERYFIQLIMFISNAKENYMLFIIIIILIIKYNK